MHVALDELPAVVWGLRTAGLIGRGTRSVVIEAGGSALTVTVEETPMKNGGAHWHFRCPGCGRRAKVLRLLGAHHLLKSLDFGPLDSPLRRAGAILFEAFGGAPGIGYTWVELQDDLTASLLQARLIELQLPINVEIGMQL